MPNSHGPSDHNPGLAPVIQPTLDSGTEALAVAAMLRTSIVRLALESLARLDVGGMFCLRDLGPAQVEGVHRLDEHERNEGLRQAFVVRGNDVPGSPGCGRGGERILEGAHVVVPARTLIDVGCVELPLLAGRVEPSEESLLSPGVSSL